MSNQNTSEVRRGQNQLVSFLWIRRSIGLLGFFFPLILILGAKLFSDCPDVLSSLSDYYHTIMRDVFAIVMAFLAFAFFTYRGPEKIDGILANLTGICALAIVFFSTSIKEDAGACLACDMATYKTIHFIFASIFFLLLSYFSLFLFTKTEKNSVPTIEKTRRNRIYRICGIIMLFSIVVIGIYLLWLKKNGIWTDVPIVLIFEWLALWAFGISWIVKGDWFIMIDK